MTLAPHGTNARYVSRKDPCRCDECLAAHATYMRGYRGGVRLGRKVPVNPRAPHGTRSRYVRGCHCAECTKANRDYQRGYMWLWRAGIPMIDITDV